MNEPLEFIKSTRHWYVRVYRGEMRNSAAKETDDGVRVQFHWRRMGFPIPLSALRKMMNAAEEGAKAIGVKL